MLIKTRTIASVALNVLELSLLTGNLPSVGALPGDVLMYSSHVMEDWPVGGASDWRRGVCYKTEQRYVIKMCVILETRSPGHSPNQIRMISGQWFYRIFFYELAKILQNIP